MNPVDHPHGGVSSTDPTTDLQGADNIHRVTINILVRLLLSRDTLPRVKRLVLLLQEERVCCVVLKRRRSKKTEIHGLIGMVFSGLLTSMDGTANGTCMVEPKARTMDDFLAQFPLWLT